MPPTVKGVCKRCPPGPKKSITGRPPLLAPCKCDICGKLGEVELSPPHPGNDIIIRNKKWVRALSRKMKAQRKLQGESELDTTRLMPKPTRNPPVKQKPKKSSLLDVIKLNRDCACELMANAIQSDLYKTLGMSELRAAINTGKFKAKPDPLDNKKQKNL